MFSATMTKEVEKLTETFFYSPEKIEAASHGTPLEKINQQKADLLYNEIDRNPLFKGTAAKEDRSNMNAVFIMENAELEKEFDVHIITQNVDNLHEQAGTKNVLHLHGELLKVKSVYNEQVVLDWKTDLFLGDVDKHGNQLRPHIVWFGEAVPAMDKALEIVEQADILIVIGTSLQVYPAAGLINYVNQNIPVYYIDPKPATIYDLPNPLEIMPFAATEGMKILREKLLNS